MYGQLCVGSERVIRIKHFVYIYDVEVMVSLSIKS